MNDQPEREYKTELSPMLKEAFGHPFDPSTKAKVDLAGSHGLGINGVPMSMLAENAYAVDLINHVRGGGKLDIHTGLGWVAASYALKLENLADLNDPDKFRKAEVKQPVSTPFQAKHVLSYMQFRQKDNPVDTWSLPASVSSHGVWLSLGNGRLSLIPWDLLAREWLWNSPGERSWRRCDMEHAPELSLL